MGDGGDEWRVERIGTEREKMQVERELQELRGRLALVEEWKARRESIERELAQVWVEGGDVLGPPAYVKEEVRGGTKDISDPGETGVLVDGS